MFTSFGMKNGRGKIVARARWSIGMREKPRSVTCAEIQKWSFLMHCRCVAAWTDPANLERSILGQQMTVYSLEVAQKCVPRPRLTCFRWNICHTRRCYIACRLHPETRSTMIHTPTHHLGKGLPTSVSLWSVIRFARWNRSRFPGASSSGCARFPPIPGAHPRAACAVCSVRRPVCGWFPATIEGDKNVNCADKFDAGALPHFRHHLQPPRGALTSGWPAHWGRPSRARSVEMGWKMLEIFQFGCAIFRNTVLIMEILKQN